MNNEIVKGQLEKEIHNPTPLRQILMAPIIKGQMVLASPITATTVGTAGAASALPATPTGYLKITLGTTDYQIPFYALP